MHTYQETSLYTNFLCLYFLLSFANIIITYAFNFFIILLRITIQLSCISQSNYLKFTLLYPHLSLLQTQSLSFIRTQSHRTPALLPVFSRGTLVHCFFFFFSVPFFSLGLSSFFFFTRLHRVMMPPNTKKYYPLPSRSILAFLIFRPSIFWWRLDALNLMVGYW